LKQALVIQETVGGPDTPEGAITLGHLATLYATQNKSTEAAPLLERALGIWERVLGPDHPQVALTLSSTAGILEADEKYREAEPLLKRSLEIREKAQPMGPDLALSLERYAALLRKLDRTADATLLEARAKAVRTERPGEGVEQLR
jgi:tetratricopeptide (TPR) repeat protein